MLEKMIPLLLVSTALALSSPAGAAPPPVGSDGIAAAPVRIDRDRIDKALADMVASRRVAGASALVWQDGAERYYGSAGFADREAGRPMARDTLVQVFSMTKPVTGVALMQLWEQGKFRLDDPLSDYLPEFAGMQVLEAAKDGGAPTPRPAHRPITIRDLMRHTAGFSYGMRQTPADAAFVKADPLALENDLPEFGRKLAGLPLIFDPGAEWSYSVAVDVQALLVQKLSGVPFETYVREHVLTPLKMKDSGWTQPPENLPRLAATYAHQSAAEPKRYADDKTRRLNFDPSRRLTMGGAGLASSIDDYMRFARMLLNGGELDGVRIVQPSTVRLMATDQLDPAITKRFFLSGKGSVGFGLDFAVRKRQPQTPGENRGAVGEFFWDGAESTLFWVDPANRLAVVFFAQSLPFDATLHHDIRAAIYGPDYLGPKGD